MVPVGALEAPVAVSTTVAVQRVAWRIRIVAGVHATVVVVVRRFVLAGFTVTAVVPELPECDGLAESPA
jgi:hypothetical protein